MLQANKVASHGASGTTMSVITLLALTGGFLDTASFRGLSQVITSHVTGTSPRSQANLLNERKVIAAYE